MGYHIGKTQFGKWAYRVTLLWLACATPCRGMWRRRWCRSSRCGAWHTCRTARNVMASLHCSGFHNEDAMVAWVLENELKYKPMVYVKVLPCHFHDARNGTGHSQVVPTSMCVHHVAGGRLRCTDGAFRQRHIACRPCGTCLRRRDIPVVRLTNGRNDLFSVYVEF
ncbi:putative UDP-Gal or UDP-GlcNAc-dependent glycosyltransferase [Trypanosoma cruzi]|uniref:Putative UDP-Gal or UDP-GlcNAc-dependent glycosyltransferase n=1 Tax=Trypanosoma cruzi TaxID=5693 RepID=A0A2V2ULS3_TRYCR|nr:putative UDP-Gal or UDP-GlcNAc-dependent glycosyltransferase [Trypanosoma cruzi]